MKHTVRKWRSISFQHDFLTGDFACTSEPGCLERAILEAHQPRAEAQQAEAQQPSQGQQADLQWHDFDDGLYGDDLAAALQLGSHEVAPLVWSSEDGREGVFLRPFELGRYQRQQFGFVGFRFVAFSSNIELLVSYCSCPPGRCADPTGLESVFGGKDYLSCTPGEVLGGAAPLCSCARELLSSLGGEVSLRELLSSGAGPVRPVDAIDGGASDEEAGSAAGGCVMEHRHGGKEYFIVCVHSSLAREASSSLAQRAVVGYL